MREGDCFRCFHTAWVTNGPTTGLPDASADPDSGSRRKLWDGTIRGVRGRAVVNVLKASAGEASMMARCTGKTKLHNLEPEDLRALTLATADATDIVLAGLR